jgi:hypothetical protein
MISVHNNVISIIINGKKKKIGTIDRDNRLLVTERTRSKHLMNANKSYGFNHQVMKNAKAFDRIKLTDEKGTYLIPREMILQRGTFLHFLSQGYEKQIFLTLKDIENCKIESI